MSKLKDCLCSLASKADGSFKTVHDRIKIVSRFERHLRDLNIQIRSMDNIKTKHIEGYVSHRLAQGITPRTIQNEMAALRAVLHLSGRDKLISSERLTNRSLGIGNASRAGTKQAIPAEKFKQVLQVAQTRDKGFAAALQLARVLGLRSQEAVQSAQSLKTWQTALDKGATKLTVVFGTKGGRPRETTILNREQVRQAVTQALTIAEQRNGRLIDKPDLKTAMNSWRTQTIAVGLTGKHSPHSLRYAWAQEALKHYQAQGFSREEARALTAMDLGHGDGRGRYVERVYSNSGEE
ncbi:integrase domain-containing protein [Proteus mirabilis]|uniref:Putative DNA-binding prophage protein n=1 Tax=Proteus mirabilis TaxID=584 RepID=G8DRC5_PROMI|nr:integrase domain-containing protein [Proteus mirabilis]AED98744.1 putative DNA-binding prophage protein [Proteus mirabilis]MDH7535667.1 integrase domain-containing protein [Proteus mirabilis]MDM3631348.1 integrase domain-containing protein [Proteus mirabilis]MDM3642176.1 integrase domain-containing protein [Proteus mirabilis]MDM3710732.1 integrase domain-containing protein [Proteus mirabilis]